jgi:peptide-methionine (S)-S-oxide reductase
MNAITRPLLTLALAGCIAAALSGCTARAAARTSVPPPSADVQLASASGRATAVFAGGCFWGTQSVFEHVKGVLKVTAGYAGGAASTATYDQVSSETTGHAESIQVVYDPAKITYGQLLQVFFSVAHDPTQLNRQGPDQGSSYRSAIFYAGDDQRRLATSYIQQLDNAHVFSHKIVTEVAPLKGFYPAESYHQDYALHNPDNPYIFINDRPKVAALKQEFPTLYADYGGEK